MEIDLVALILNWNLNYLLIKINFPPYIPPLSVLKE